DRRLEREGFFFSSIPSTAISANGLVPEVECRASHGVPSSLVLQDRVDEIVSFALKYGKHMHRQNGHGYFTFPSREEWPTDLPDVPFPSRQKEKEFFLAMRQLA